MGMGMYTSWSYYMFLGGGVEELPKESHPAVDCAELVAVPWPKLACCLLFVRSVCPGLPLCRCI